MALGKAHGVADVETLGDLLGVPDGLVVHFEMHFKWHSVSSTWIFTWSGDRNINYRWYWAVRENTDRQEISVGI